MNDKEREIRNAERRERRLIKRTKLLPCPFCGGQPEWEEMYTSISCNNNDCAMNPWTDHRNDFTEAASAWNKRAATKQVTEQLKEWLAKTDDILSDEKQALAFFPFGTVEFLKDQKRRIEAILDKQ